MSTGRWELSNSCYSMKASARATQIHFLRTKNFRLATPDESSYLWDSPGRMKGKMVSQKPLVNAL